MVVSIGLKTATYKRWLESNKPYFTKPVLKYLTYKDSVMLENSKLYGEISFVSFFE